MLSGKAIYSSIVLLLAVPACGGTSGSEGAGSSTEEVTAAASSNAERVVLSCETENSSDRAPLHMDIVDRGSIDDPFKGSYGGRLKVELSTGETQVTLDFQRVRFNSDGLCATDPTRRLTDSDGTNRVDLTFANDDQCEDGQRRVRGFVRERRANLPPEMAGLQTGSFCCTDNIEIPRFSAPPVAPICAERGQN